MLGGGGLRGVQGPNNDQMTKLGKVSKKMVEFSTKRLTPPPVSGKKLKTKKNDLLAMKQILYDMGPLTLVRWLL